MKHKARLMLLLMIFLPALNSLNTNGQEPGVTTSTGKAVHIESLPASWVVVREVQGGYEKHTQVFDELMRYVGANFRAVGYCFGIYPTDPDAVKSGTQRWQVGVRVVPGKALGYGNNLPMQSLTRISTRQLEQQRRQFRKAESPYRLELLDATETAVVESSVEEAPQDGLSMFGWMAKNGYVQIGPTRMEYLSHEGAPNKIPTRIVVPVKKRPSGLTVKVSSDFGRRLRP